MRVGVGIERIKDYLELDQEAPARSQSPPPARWPSSHGGITIENLVVRYAPHLPPVLRRISFTINPHEKIGVVCLSLSISQGAYVALSRRLAGLDLARNR